MEFGSFPERNYGAAFLYERREFTGHWHFNANVQLQYFVKKNKTLRMVMDHVVGVL